METRGDLLKKELGGNPSCLAVEAVPTAKEFVVDDLAVEVAVFNELWWVVVGGI